MGGLFTFRSLLIGILKFVQGGYIGPPLMTKKQEIVQRVAALRVRQAERSCARATSV